MVTWVILALVIIAAILGFGGLIALTAAIFRLLFWILLAVFIMVLIARFAGSRRVIV